MKTLLLALLLFTYFSCKKSAESKRTYEYFAENLKAGMNYTSIVKLFHEPDEDKGSGIHIYTYKLSDSTEIWIGFTDHILYARHQDSSGALLHTLI